MSNVAIFLFEINVKQLQKEQTRRLIKIYQQQCLATTTNSTIAWLNGSSKLLFLYSTALVSGGLTFSQNPDDRDHVRCPSNGGHDF